MKLKTKYERMNKEEKKELYKEYKIEKKEFVKKMNRMFLLVWIGIGYSIFMFLYDLLRSSKLGYWLDIILLIFCIFVLVKLILTKKELLNKFALDKNKKKKK